VAEIAGVEGGANAVLKQVLRLVRRYGCG